MIVYVLLEESDEKAGTLLGVFSSEDVAEGAMLPCAAADRYRIVPVTVDSYAAAGVGREIVPPWRV